MKKTIEDSPIATADVVGTWLDLDAIAEVSVSSEDPGYPIENVFHGRGEGWRAATPGAQHLALKFHAPTAVQRVRFVFEERSRARTQEFALDWRAVNEGASRNVVRQQFTFAPPGTSVEIEDYAPNLRDVVQLELTIVPDINDPSVVATLKDWRIAGAASRSPR
jgi:hypothetical protein